MSETLYVRVRQSKISVKVAKGGMTVNRLSTNAPEPVGLGAAAGEGPNASAEDHVHELTFTTVQTLLENAPEEINFNGQNLGNIADPTEQQHAATKAYVDANAGGGGGETTVRVAMDEDAALSSAYGDACYTNTGATGLVVASLPTSASIGSSRWRARLVVTTAQRFMLEAQGLDSLNYFGNAGASLESSNVGDVLDVEYVGGGAFVVTGVVGQGWAFP